MPIMQEIFLQHQVPAADILLCSKQVTQIGDHFPKVFENYSIELVVDTNLFLETELDISHLF